MLVEFSFFQGEYTIRMVYFVANYVFTLLFLPNIAKAKKSEPHRSACHEASRNTGFPTATPPPNGYTATPHGLRSRCHATILVRPYASSRLHSIALDCAR